MAETPEEIIAETPEEIMTETSEETFYEPGLRIIKEGEDYEEGRKERKEQK